MKMTTKSLNTSNNLTKLKTFTILSQHLIWVNYLEILTWWMFICSLTRKSIPKRTVKFSHKCYLSEQQILSILKTTNIWSPLMLDYQKRSRISCTSMLSTLPLVFIRNGHWFLWRNLMVNLGTITFTWTRDRLRLLQSGTVLTISCGNCLIYTTTIVILLLMLNSCLSSVAATLTPLTWKTLLPCCNMPWTRFRMVTWTWIALEMLTFISTTRDSTTSCPSCLLCWIYISLNT